MTARSLEREGMKRARSKPVPSGSPLVHFDAGSPPKRDHLDELRGTYRGPAEDDPEAKAAVIEWLARLLDRPGEG